MSFEELDGFTDGQMEGELSVQKFEYYIMQLERELRIPQLASPRFDPSHA